MRKLLPFLYLVALLGGLCALFLGRAHTQIDTDIESLLGTSPKSGEFAKADINKELQAHFVILMSGEDVERHTQETIDTLSKLSGIELNSTDVSRKMAEFYWSYRAQLLSSRMRSDMNTMTPQLFAQNRVAELLSPVSRSAGSTGTFMQDPFALHADWMLGLLDANVRILPTEIPSIEIDDQRWLIIAGQVATNKLSEETKQFLSGLVEKLEPDRSGAQEPIEYRISGSIFHMLYGEKLSKSEIGGIGLISASTIMLILLLFFRGWPSLFFVATVLLGSTTFAFLATWLVFGSVHAVTLIFGSTLLGLAIDYCFHFLAKYYYFGDAAKALRTVRKGLLLGLVSSVIAYSVQFSVPLEGVRQFSVFISTGLVAAACAVLTLSSWLPAREPMANRTAQSIFSWLSSSVFIPLARFSLMPLILGVITVAMLVAVYTHYSVRDDIRSMNTSPVHLLESEQFINQHLGGVSVGHYLNVEAKSDERLLANLESLQDSLKEVRLHGIHNFVPSTERQLRDHQQVSEFVYGERGAFYHLCTLLSVDCSGAPGPEKFNALTMQQIHDADLALPVASSSNHRTEVQIKPRSPNDLATVAVAADSLQGIAYVDRVSQITQTLSTFRVEISQVLIAFLLLILPAFWFIFGAKAVLLYVPSLMCVVAGTLAASVGDITLFHVLALFLVFGLSLDSSAFMMTAGFSAEVWWASLMSTFTSIVVFGLLSFSAVPMLSQFGIVVFVGLASSLLITPIIFSIDLYSRHSVSAKAKT